MYQAMIIDDDEDYRNLLQRKLKRSFTDIEVKEIDPLSMEMPDENHPWEDVDFIILDYQLGLDFTGLDWYKRFQPESMPATILLTARGSEELAVRAIKLGVDDYIVKEHFDNDQLINSINECVYNKRLEQARLRDASHRSNVFNKSSFIRRLSLITREMDINNHLLMFNPLAYREVGKEKGLAIQDNYINNIADWIYYYLSSKKIDFNMFVYKDEYIAVIIQINSFKRHLGSMYRKLDKETYQHGLKHYPCSCSVGVVSPRSLEANEFERSDFELLDIAQALCDDARTLDTDRIRYFGDVNLKDLNIRDAEDSIPRFYQKLNIDEAISDGRVAANYQPWIYISFDETASLKDIFDVRIEVIDIDGNRYSQRELLSILDDAYARRVVDRWVIRNSISQLVEMAETSGKPANVKLAVRITLSSVSDPEFLPWLRELINEVDVPVSNLFFEIESSQLMRDPELYRNMIKQLSESYGIKFILSGIYQIETYYQSRKVQRFDYVKLNVKDLVYGFPRQPLYDLIKDIKSEGSRIVSVNVSDAEMLSLASQFDIDYVHGYLVGKPYIDIVTDSEGDVHCVI